MSYQEHDKCRGCGERTLRKCDECGLEWIREIGDCPQCCRMLHRDEAAQNMRQAMENGEAANELRLRLEARDKLLRDIKNDLAVRADCRGSNAVELGATLWNRLCDITELSK